MSGEIKIIDLNVSLRLFLKPDADLESIAELVDRHFGNGCAIVGSGCETDTAKALMNAVIQDIAVSDSDAAATLKSTLVEVDLWRDGNTRGDQEKSYSTESC